MNNVSWDDPYIKCDEEDVVKFDEYGFNEILKPLFSKYGLTYDYAWTIWITPDGTYLRLCPKKDGEYLQDPEDVPEGLLEDLKLRFKYVLNREDLDEAAIEIGT
jgi:hypothetical protein